MKIRLKTMSEQTNIDLLSLCSPKCEMFREKKSALKMYTYGRSKHTCTHKTHTHTCVYSEQLSKDEWFRVTVIIKYIWAEWPLLLISNYKPIRLSAKVATLFNFLIWFSNRRVPFLFFCSSHCPDLFTIFTIDFNSINAVVHESYYDIKVSFVLLKLLREHRHSTNRYVSLKRK